VLHSLLAEVAREQPAPAAGGLIATAAATAINSIRDTDGAAL
jgi:hypothetical protein